MPVGCDPAEVVGFPGGVEFDEKTVAWAGREVRSRGWPPGPRVTEMERRFQQFVDVERVWHGKTSIPVGQANRGGMRIGRSG